MNTRREVRGSRTALFDDIEEGGIRASSSYSSHEINEHENERAMDGLQDRVLMLKRLTGDIHEEVEGHNRMLDRMGNDMDSSRGILSGTMDKFKTVFETKSSRRMFTLVASFVMTTSSANNSVFRGFFVKQKLIGPNFIDWYQQLRIVLSIEDTLNYLEQPIPPAPVVPAGQHVAPDILAAHNAWIKGSKEIAGLMLMPMEPDIQRNLETIHAHEMLLELKTLFAQQAEQELLQTTRDFHSCKQEEGQSVSSYVLRMKGYIDNLERLGYTVTLSLGVSLILIGLRKEFDGFVQNYNMHSLGKTINELHAMLKLHEQTLQKNNAPALHAIRAGKDQKVNKHKKSQTQMAARGQNHGKRKNKQAYAPKPKIPPPPKREDPAKDSICHECGETGHWKRNCPQYLAELLKKKKNVASGAGGSGIFLIELNTILNRSWIYDTGCGTHICNTTQGLRANRKLKPGALSLYVSNGQREIVEDYGIIAHRTPPYTPQHNGVSEWRNRTLLDMVRSMMSQTTLPKSFWDYALETVAVWGCEALVKRDTLTKPDKLEPRSIKCIFIGYPKETIGYSFYYPPENKVLVARNAEFLENSLITQKASGNLEDLEIIQEEDTHPSIDTSLNHEEDDPEIDEPQSDIVPIRRSTKTRHAPDRMCLYIDAKEHELGDLGEPANYKSALLDTKSEKRLNAINVEMQSMKDNEVWVLVELPPNGKTIGSKWLFKKKTEMDRVVHTYKARLVAKGYTQTPGIDYEETFSPVADIIAIRILIAIDVYYDYEIWQIDVKTSFLNVYLNEEVYIEQPECFVNQKYPNRVCKLKRSIYGLKQASRQWNKRFDDEIKKFGFTQNYDEPCVYLKASGSNITFLILYVDDILIMGNNIPMLQGVKSYLGRCFAMKDLGEAAYIIRIKIYRDRSRQLISLCQSAYIKKILKRYCMENSKRESIPMQEKLKLSKSQGASTPAELKRMQNVLYASVVGSIMYDVGCTRPDSAKQSIFATSSAEAEYIVAFDASKEAVWVRKFISGLGVVLTIKEPISMYCDNIGAIAIANESGITKGGRHVRAKVHYLCKVIEYGVVKLEKVHTDDNLADPFTKALTFPKHSEHTRNIRMLPATFTTLVFNKEFVPPLDVQTNTLAPLQN
nr:retrotransposon protein, putative, Ty1-copia subclass [Tanacetum cinerariifolium]